MPREIAPDLHWISECGPDRSGFMADVEGPPPDWYDPDQALHIPNCAYLFTDEQSLLFDTLSPAMSDEIFEAVDALVDDGLDYLAVSHPDVPHAGNTVRLLERYPDCTLVAPRYGKAHELYHLDGSVKVGEGDAIELGRYTVDFHEATFPDAALHMWMSERETGTLFPVDWFGFPHRADECDRFVEAFDHPLDVDRLVQFHGRVMFWYQYVDVPKVQAEIRRVIETHDPEIVAPAHGNPLRDSPRDALDLMPEVVAEINERDRIGTLG